MFWWGKVVSQATPNLQQGGLGPGHSLSGLYEYLNKEYKAAGYIALPPYTIRWWPHSEQQNALNFKYIYSYTAQFSKRLQGKTNPKNINS